MFLDKEKLLTEWAKDIEKQVMTANENCEECIKNANAFYDYIINRITDKRDQAINEIKAFNEKSHKLLIEEKEELGRYLKAIDSIKQKRNQKHQTDEIEEFIELKDANEAIGKLDTLKEKDLFSKTVKKYVLNQTKEIDSIKSELEDYKKTINDSYLAERDGESDEGGNQSNGKITNTNQEIGIVNASSEPSNTEANANHSNSQNITEISNEIITTKVDLFDISKSIMIKPIEHIKSVDLQANINIPITAQDINGTNKVENNSIKNLDYIDINNQSSFKYSKGNSIKPSPKKNSAFQTLFPPLKSSSSNQLNQIGTFKNISSFLNSNYSECDSLNSSTSNCQLIQSNTFHNQNEKDTEEFNESLSSPKDLKKTKLKSHGLFDAKISKELSTNHPISPFLRNYLMENSTELSYGMNYTSSIISNNNLQEISALYKERTTSYILIGGKTDVITREWCRDTFQWSTLTKPSSNKSNGGKDLSIERSDYALLKYKDKKALAIGGKVNSNGMESLTDSIQLLDIEKKTVDKLDFKLKTPKCAFGGLYILSQIFLAGGSDGRFVSNSFEYFDKKTKEWYDLPRMYAKRKHFAFISSFDNCIFAIGGQDDRGAILKSVERYDINRKVWVKVKEMNQNRRSSCAVCMPDGIYVIGGYDGAQYLKSVEKYDFQTKKWVYLSDMNYTKSDFCVKASIDCRYIYTFGGYNGKPLNVIEQFDVLADQWKHIASMPNARYKHQILETTNEVIIQVNDRS